MYIFLSSCTIYARKIVQLHNSEFNFKTCILVRSGFIFVIYIVAVIDLKDNKYFTKTVKRRQFDQ